MADLWHKNFPALVKSLKKVLAPQPPATPKASKVVGGEEARPKCGCRRKPHSITCPLSMWEALQTGKLLPVTTPALLAQALPGDAKQSQPAQGSASKSAAPRLKIPKLASPAAEASPAASAAPSPKAVAAALAAAPDAVAAALAAAPAPAGQCLYLCNLVNTWPHRILFDVIIIRSDGPCISLYLIPIALD